MTKRLTFILQSNLGHKYDTNMSSLYPIYIALVRTMTLIFRLVTSSLYASKYPKRLGK